MLRDETRSLPKEIFLWLDDIQVAVIVEVDKVVPHREGYSQQWSDHKDGGIDRPIPGSDDGNKKGDDCIKEDSSDCADSCSETELEDDVVRVPNLKFKLDCAALELDSVGCVHIRCNGP